MEKLTDPNQSSRRGIPLYESNPFIHEPETTKTEEHTFTEVVLVSREELIRAKAARIKKLLGLNVSGTRMLELFLSESWLSGDSICLLMSFKKAALLSSKISRSTYSRGMAELVSKGLIALNPTQGAFWVNKSLVSIGESLVLVRQLKLKDDTLNQVEISK